MRTNEGFIFIILNKKYMIQIECCDNLELMSKIESNTVDLIYCDILYGTGRKFADYQDLKPIRSEIENHYIPRIKEMHRILKDTGSIYLQMDTRINHWIRCIMDDIFSYDNFRNEIVWCYKSGAGSKNTWSNKHDVILFYSKTFAYKKIEYRETELSEGTKKGYPNASKNNGFIWQTQNGKLYKISCYAHGRDWIELKQVNHKDAEYVKYDTQKPKALIERIIKASSNEGDLVADFYMGSGTTCEVALELGRKFIGCDINPRAVELSKKRCGIFS